MQRLAVTILGPKEIETRLESFKPDSSDDLLVETICSAVSAGTELLFYRGQIPSGLAVDATIDSLQETVEYPLKYGYAAVGRVVEAQRSNDEEWIGRLVFSFQPHVSHFWSSAAALIPLPEGLTPEQGIFLPNMESAVNFLHDGEPLLGEKVLVLGQGVVGLLTTALLARLPLAQIVTLDALADRRELSRQWGAHLSMDPDEIGQLRAALVEPDGDEQASGADLTYELSGNPQALDLAIQNTAFSGRVVVGSWYGTKSAPLELGGRFHRSRIRLISSQVSTVDPRLTGRWSKDRRMRTVIEQIRHVKPERAISHRFSVEQADQAYRLLDQGSEGVLQVVFTYQ